METPEKKDHEVERAEWKARSRRSFIIAGASALAGISGWAWLMRRPDEDGIPWPLRRVLEWNGEIAHALFDSKRMPPLPPAPPKGKRPRFNGDIGIDSPIDLSQWKMRVISPSDKGPVEISLSMADIRLLPKTSTTTEFKCIEGWSEINAYAGVRFSDFLAHLGLGKRSSRTGEFYRYVGLETPDGEYYVSIDMDSMLHPQTLLAYEMNGVPLDPANGAPLRLMIPVKYGIKSLKRIGSIQFSDQRPPDYWAERGYDWYAGL